MLPAKMEATGTHLLTKHRHGKTQLLADLQWLAPLAHTRQFGCVSACHTCKKATRGLSLTFRCSVSHDGTCITSSSIAGYLPLIFDQFDALSVDGPRVFPADRREASVQVECSKTCSVLRLIQTLWYINQ